MLLLIDVFFKIISKLLYFFLNLSYLLVLTFIYSSIALFTILFALQTTLILTYQSLYYRAFMFSLQMFYDLPWTDYPN